MRLTIEEDRETIKRYGHIKPARGRASDLCLSTCPGTVRTCTLARGHRGPHVAHGTFKKVVAVWDAGPDDRRPMGIARRGVPARARGGILEALRDRILSLGSSVETIVFLVMFVAFVGFAIHWFLLFTGAIR